MSFGMEKLEWCGYTIVKKSLRMFNRFDRIPACDRRTNRSDSVLRAMHSITR